MSSDRLSEAEDRGFNPAVQHRIWRDWLLPRTVVPLFWAAWLILLPARLMGTRARRRQRLRQPVVALESGIVGWTHVFFEELIGAARDYMGAEHVVQHTIDRDRAYLPQFRANVERDDPTHVVLDMRTPGQTWGRTLVEAVAVSARLLRAGRTPVVILTDALYRRQRWQAACLTAHSGVVLTLTSIRILRPIFPHRRIVGPLPMPISQDRLRWLEEIADDFPHDGSIVQFIGSVYPPRSDLLGAVSDGLAARGIEFRINGDKWGTSSDDYWRTLAAADVVFTTSMQGPDQPIMDWIWVQHLVFRWHETLAAGAAMVAPRVEGAERFFLAGKDFLEFESVDDAVSAIELLVRDADLRHDIASSGHATSVELVRTQAFWLIADSMLSSHPMRSSAIPRLESDGQAEPPEH